MKIGDIIFPRNIPILNQSLFGKKRVLGKKTPNIKKTIPVNRVHIRIVPLKNKG